MQPKRKYDLLLGKNNIERSTFSNYDIMYPLKTSLAIVIVVLVVASYKNISHHFFIRCIMFGRQLKPKWN